MALEEIEDEPVSPARNDFVLYLLEENRELKEGLRDRERQLRSLQDRALNLERECGEQRGTASTQARVLEWFQRQPMALALPSGESESATPTSLPVSPTWVKHWTAVAALLTLVLSLVVVIKAF
ncbi:hypothetical protein IV102_29570 [bacterium]|nr:hypothetical protein [bacterium]